MFEACKDLIPDAEMANDPKQDDYCETCLTMNVWFDNSVHPKKKKPLTLMTCGRNGSLSDMKSQNSTHINGVTSTCENVTSVNELETVKNQLKDMCEHKVGNATSKSKASACCKILEDIQAVSVRHCNGTDMCNIMTDTDEPKCNMRYNLVQNKKNKTTTTPTISSEETTSVKHTRINKHTPKEKIVTEAIVPLITTVNAESGSDRVSNPIIKALDFANFKLILMFHIFTTTFIMLNQAA